ncbi:hypothetical protein ACE1SV_49160 [Streptomyces sp. E-15]
MIGCAESSAAITFGEIIHVPVPIADSGLGELLVDLTWFIESVDDKHMDQDDAVKALEAG